MPKVINKEDKTIKVLSFGADAGLLALLSDVLKRTNKRLVNLGKDPYSMAKFTKVLIRIGLENILTLEGKRRLLSNKTKPTLDEAVEAARAETP